MSIAVRYLIFFVTLTGMLLATLASISMQAISAEHAAQAEHQRYESRKLAEELRQSSDDLTRMARTYVVTGDTTYERYFYDILAIRNGTKPRPVHYDDVYWDFITSSSQPQQNTTHSIPLLALMEQAGFTDNELNSLSLALDESNKLAKIEMRAFGAMKGLFADETGALTVMGAPNPELARALVHNQAYHSAKAKIMEPINTFFTPGSSRAWR